MHFIKNKKNTLCNIQNCSIYSWHLRNQAMTKKYVEKKFHYHNCQQITYNFAFSDKWLFTNTINSSAFSCVITSSRDTLLNNRTTFSSWQSSNNKWMYPNIARDDSIAKYLSWNSRSTSCWILSFTVTWQHTLVR